eukprot:gene11673-483_t
MGRVLSCSPSSLFAKQEGPFDPLPFFPFPLPTHGPETNGDDVTCHLGCVLEIVHAQICMNNLQYASEMTGDVIADRMARGVTNDLCSIGWDKTLGRTLEARKKIEKGSELMRMELPVILASYEHVKAYAKREMVGRCMHMADFQEETVLRLVSPYTTVEQNMMATNIISGVSRGLWRSSCPTRRGQYERILLIRVALATDLAKYVDRKGHGIGSDISWVALDKPQPHEIKRQKAADQHSGTGILKPINFYFERHVATLIEIKDFLDAMNHKTHEAFYIDRMDPLKVAAEKMKAARLFQENEDEKEMRKVERKIQQARVTAREEAKAEKVTAKLELYRTHGSHPFRTVEIAESTLSRTAHGRDVIQEVRIKLKADAALRSSAPPHLRDLAKRLETTKKQIHAAAKSKAERTVEAEKVHRAKMKDIDKKHRETLDSIDPRLLAIINPIDYVPAPAMAFVESLLFEEDKLAVTMVMEAEMEIAAAHDLFWTVTSKMVPVRRLWSWWMRTTWLR